MSSHARQALARTFLGLIGAALLAADSAVAQQTQELLGYRRAGEQGAKAYNLADRQGVVVLEIPQGTILAVHGERTGWLDVEAPGGFRVWVWGEYLEATEEEGVVRVAGNDVRMRPLPSSEIESYALTQKLGRGQKLRVIGRKDESLPLSSDWVQVWSPPGARAWVAAADTVPLESGASGPALWGAAVAETLAARKPVAVAKPASAPKDAGRGEAQAAAAPGAGQDAASALQRAEALFSSEMAKDDAGAIPDYAAARAAYESVLALTAEGPAAERARTRLGEVELRADAYQVRHDLEIERARRAAEAKAARERMEAAGKRDAFYGRFDVRGWLERRVEPGQTDPLWVLNWSGADAAELVCFSGRYDLSVFEGFELGINGRALHAAMGEGAGRPARAAKLDVLRIEVLAGRPTAKR